MSSFGPTGALGFVSPGTADGYSCFQPSAGAQSGAQRCQVHQRQKRKHKLEEEGLEECSSPKRFLSEETMAACLQQLNITNRTIGSHPSSMELADTCDCGPSNRQPMATVSLTPEVGSALLNTLRTNPLNIKTVGSCPNTTHLSDTVDYGSLARGSIAAHVQTSNISTEDDTSLPSLREDTEFEATCSNLRMVSSWPRTDSSLLLRDNENFANRILFEGSYGTGASDREHPQSHSPVTSPTTPKSLDLTSRGGFPLRKKPPPHHTGVQIKVTPATPTGFSREDVMPVATSSSQPSPLLPRGKIAPSTLSRGVSSLRPSGWSKNWDVILEDISSDSSDGMDTPDRPTSVWLAPEIRSSFSTRKNESLLPPSILEEINKKGLELVPWVGPEHCFAQAILKAQGQAEEMNDETPEEEPSDQCSSDSIEEDKMWDYSDLEMEA